MKFDQLLDVEAFRRDAAAGYISEKTHPTLPLSILNYTPKAQYDNYWSQATRICRGLIVDNNTRDIISRPFEKFFNYDDGERCAAIEMTAEVEVLDKIDGSLGILYPDPNQQTGWAIATRGSFTSDQAKHATARYQTSHSDFRPREGWTYLFEIVYPDNRIVVNYGVDDNLYLIGVINNSSGKKLSLRHPSLGIPRASLYPFKTYDDFLRNWEPKDGIEGVVVHDLSTGSLVKVKTEEYITLHRITFSMSAKTIWESLKNGTFLDYAALPSTYLQQWAVETAEEILDRRAELSGEIAESWVGLVGSCGYSYDADDIRAHRKEVALWIQKNDPLMAKYLFSIYDGGQRLDDIIWKAIEPVGDIRPTLTQSVEA